MTLKEKYNLLVKAGMPKIQGLRPLPNKYWWSIYDEEDIKEHHAEQLITMKAINFVVDKGWVLRIYRENEGYGDIVHKPLICKLETPEGPNYFKRNILDVIIEALLNDAKTTI